MYELIQKITSFFSGIWGFIKSVAGALASAFGFIVYVWASVSAQIDSFPAWLKALIAAAVVISIVLIVLLSR